MDNMDLKSSGIISEDPALTLPVGAAIKYRPCLVTHHAKSAAEYAMDWASFEGILLIVSFSNGQRQNVDGSAVMIGPGMAFTATHVIEPHFERLMSGEMGCILTAITREGLKVWRLSKINKVPNSDITILGLSFASSMPSDMTFNIATISTRMPRLGEQSFISGFRASGYEFEIKNNDASFSGSVLICTGEVTKRFFLQRDAHMLNFPCLEINCPALGGMSGGPVFDKHGMLIGLLSSSFEDGPAYVSLIWPALGIEFEGGWPASFFKGKFRLVDLPPSFCLIDKPSAITFGTDAGNAPTRLYEMWE